MQTVIAYYDAITAVLDITSLAAGLGKNKIVSFFTELDNPITKKELLEKAKSTNSAEAADAQKILDVETELKAYSEAKYGQSWWKNGANISPIAIIREALGFRPPNPLNFTGFVANSTDNYIDIIIHYKNGSFVVSKEGNLLQELSIGDLADIINNAPSGKTVRLLSCNDLNAAKELSGLTTKPFYASDGWVELYKNGEVRSANDFFLFQNGQKSTTNKITANQTDIDEVESIRLGVSLEVRAARNTTRLTAFNTLKSWCDLNITGNSAQTLKTEFYKCLNRLDDAELDDFFAKFNNTNTPLGFKNVISGKSLPIALTNPPRPAITVERLISTWKQIRTSTTLSDNLEFLTRFAKLPPSKYTFAVNGSNVEIRSGTTLVATVSATESTCKAGTDAAKDWNAYLNIHPPLPSHKYTINTVGYTFETDALGRVNKVTATLDNSVRGRNETQQGLAVSLKDGIVGDEGGHLIANILNGIGEQLNYVAMNGNLNKGAWKTMENELKRLISQTTPITIEIDIDIVYPANSNSKRPGEFLVNLKYDRLAQTRRDFVNR